MWTLPRAHPQASTSHALCPPLAACVWRARLFDLTEHTICRTSLYRLPSHRSLRAHAHDTPEASWSLLPFTDAVESAIKFVAHHIKHRRKCDKVFIEQSRAASTLPTRIHRPRRRPTTRTRATAPRRAKMSQVSAMISLPAQAPWSDWLDCVSGSCWWSAQLEITKSETWQGESEETWQVSRNVTGTEAKHGRYAPAMSL